MTCPVSVTAPADAAFEHWLSARGFQLSGCRLAAVNNTDPLHGGRLRGLVATRDLPSGHVLFRVPREAVLAPERSALWPALREAAMECWNALVAAMTFESVRQDSYWKPYLEALPRELDTPPFWDAAELALLEGTRVDERANLHAVRESYETVVRPFYESHKDLFPSEAARSFETYRRFGAIVLAYSFSVGGGGSSDVDEGKPPCKQSAMVPMADMLNATPTKTSAHLFARDDGSYEMQTICAVREGDEIFNTYGDRPNCELLVRYGYVCTVNPANAAALSAAEFYRAVRASRGSDAGDAELCLSRARLCLRRMRRRGEVTAGVEQDDGPPFAIEEVVFPIRLATRSRRHSEGGGRACGSRRGGLARVSRSIAASSSPRRASCRALWRLALGACRDLEAAAVLVRDMCAARLRRLAAGADAEIRMLVTRLTGLPNETTDVSLAGLGCASATESNAGAAADHAHVVAHRSRRIRYARAVRDTEIEIFSALQSDAEEVLKEALKKAKNARR